MRLVLTLLTIVSLLTGNLTAAAAVLATLSPAPAAAAAGLFDETGASCADCGREATAAAPCSTGCLLPPADLASGIMALSAPRAERPAALSPAIPIGRDIRPDLRPPQAR